MALAMIVVGCGSGADGDGGVERSATIERDPAGDVIDYRAADRLLAEPDLDPRTFARAVAADRPDLDLREARLATAGRTLRLSVRTEAPIGTATLELTASADESCADAQLTVYIRVGGDGETTVRATDLPDRPARAVKAAVEIDGSQLTLTLPLKAAARFPRWHLSSYDTPPEQAMTARYGDMVPEWGIERVEFTRGTGAPVGARALQRTLHHAGRAQRPARLPGLRSAVRRAARDAAGRRRLSSAAADDRWMRGGEPDRLRWGGRQPAARARAARRMHPLRAPGT
ncbi:hypothetical protein [Conexibacter arvalis]|uniref:Uncharacterized protein n=1 Tax=Conexibacter arvalis TaxID=912552 RepID=A0A840IAV8_9ACTN|nr:hypothetical protein [Conexibacter arvalis]MBB4661383.1 hypothetical protein [Conexibacter arvalis]